MECSLSWSLTLFSACLVFMTVGIQYTIILPTIWDYLIGRFEAEHWLYGICITASSLCNVIAGPIVGAIYDKTHTCRLLVILTTLTAAAGCFMYFAATSQYMVLGGRLLQDMLQVSCSTGLGLAAGTVISGEFARITTRKQRTPIYSLLTAMTQIGYTIGPGFNIALRYLDFQLGPFKLDKYTSPGLFMTGLWILSSMLFLMCFYHQRTVYIEEESIISTDSHESYTDISVDGKPSTSSGIVTDETFEQSYEVLEITGVNGAVRVVPYHASRESTPAFRHKRFSSPVENNDSAESGKAPKRLCCLWMISVIANISMKTLWAGYMLVWEEIVVLLYVLFIMMFSEMAVEVAFTPTVEKYFQWNEFPISIYFLVAGVLMVTSSIVVSIISKKVSDRTMIFSGLIIELASCLWLMGWFCAVDTITVLPQFLIGTTVILITEPFSLGCGVSLFSKKLNPEVQGLGHGVRRSLVSLGCVLGALWASSAVQLNSSLVLYGGQIFLLLLGAILMLFSFKKLKG